ncbi:MAG: UDP-N-acetylmuramate/alanine ligase [Ignavibacteria bacterium]|nr:UDP-N-acetylmuramate/alanine ligase [Ignavibacteria bacterium]
MFTTIRNIHFVGIGGIGMSGIAEILMNQGFNVSGSDMARSENTDYLASLGAKIFIEHKEENITDAELVVYSSAVNPESNPETQNAARLKIPVIRRAEMLSEVSRLNYCLAIAGTHGKTTTTSMCGLILIQAGIDPTVIVGGRLADFGGTNARLGKGQWTVLEADEFDRSFLQLLPTIAVINNIEAEHLDIYKDIDDLQQTFTQFANKAPFYGVVVVGLDDSGVCDILSHINKKIVSFGLSPHCNYYAEEIEFNGKSTKFMVFENGTALGLIEINIPGIHNVKNALAAIAASRTMGIDFEAIRVALSQFTGVTRRFDIKGERNGVLIVDDYAHHPTEVKATLKAAREGWKRRIVCVFQPHTYTRTRDFYKDFARSFFDADVLVVTDVYPAREMPIEGIDGRLIADTTSQYGHKCVHYIERFDDLYTEVPKLLAPGDLLITIGAGNIVRVADFIMNN